jgi:subfamily B ATP-binding cassette protein MsbA
MKLNFSNNFAGYFSFYYSVLGNRLILNLVLSIFISFLDGMGLAMFIPLLQSVGDGKNMSASQEETMGGLHYLTDAVTGMGFNITVDTVLVVLVILFVVKGALKFIQLKYQVHIRHTFMRTVRYRLVDDLQHLSYRGFLGLDAGRVHNTLTSEVQRLYQGMNNYFNAAQSVVMLGTYVLLAIMANYQFAFLVAIGAGMSNFLYRKIYNSTKRISLEISRKGNNFNSFLVQAVSHFKYLKSTNYFETFARKLKNVIRESELLSRKTGTYNAITNSIKEPIIIVIVVLVIQAQLKLMGASLSTILLSLLLFYRALTYLMVIQNHWQYFIQNTGSMNSVATLLTEMESMQEVQMPVAAPTIQQGITIRDVSFSYGPNAVLQHIDLQIPRNHTIALVGESGSGKTTLANMIAGLIKPDTGELQLDGTSLQQYNLDSFRSKIGYISQEPVIFNDDIYNNVTFWAEPTEANRSRFWQIIELASLTTFITNLPAKEKTNLGDNGILISGGQKQRISIARELFKAAEVLILDEATSALDSETEKIIQGNVEMLHGRYTIVIIAHRLSTIKNADAIYLLEKGKVAASGSFSEMLERSARFKRMVELQEF